MDRAAFDLPKRQHGRAGRLPPLQRWLAYLLFIACGGSGLAYLLGHELQIARDILADHLMLVLHGMSAAMMLVLAGSVLSTHVRMGWRIRRNLWTGLLILGVLLLLAVSGELLYYGSEESRDLSLWVHWVVGVMTIALAPLHVLIGRRSAGQPLSR